MTLVLAPPCRDVGSISVNPERLLSELHELSRFGRIDGGITRLALSPVDMQARGWLAERMRRAGLTADIDGVGNLVGRTPHARRIIIGSHTDTVPNGGWLDGAMGVVCGLEIARAFMERGGEGPIGLEIVSFSDEEGSYVPLLGSHSYCGTLDLGAALRSTNRSNVTLAAALQAAGISESPRARLDPAVHLAYLEVHIEQGPVLEARGIPIGLVTAIVGIRRWQVDFIGQADHAGTTPMQMRRDAGAALCDFAVKVADFCRREGGTNTVWNGGDIRLTPGAHSVVPARGEYIFSVRDADASVLTRIGEGVTELLAQTATSHCVTTRLTEIFSMAPAAMDRSIIDLIGAASRVRGLTAVELPSGALHDAMVLARRVPAGMLFIPSIGGRSHDLSEDSKPKDIVDGAHVLAETVTSLLAHLQ
jgi:beta-ureidopropionase / N-carbamoyl-L-amino-acid hydrolase